MTTNKERFEMMLDRDLEAAKRGVGCVLATYIRAKKLRGLPSKGNRAPMRTVSQLAEQFDATKWQEQKEALKAKTLAAYDGATAEPSAEDIGNKVVDGGMNAVGGGVSSMLTGADFGSGLSHGMRHALLSGIMGIPFVGDFLAKITAFVGSHIKSMFGMGGDDYKAFKLGSGLR